jgi:hypothetical protein
MGLIKSAADLAYTFRFLALLVTPFNKTKAYEKGIIDENGKRLKKPPFSLIQDREDYQNYYTRFIRLVFNIKKLLAKAPGGKTRIASYAAALYLIKEDFGVSERKIKQGLNEYGVDFNDFLSENTQWFMLEDRELSPGVYTLTENKVLNSTYEEIAFRGDRIRISDESFPIGDIFGLDIYEAIHMPTNQKIFVTAGEIRK